VRCLQEDLADALAKEDWARVRRLDQACVLLIDKIIAANKEDGYAVFLALRELKDVYASLIVQCQREAAAL
jgi:flagellar protein FliT